MPSFRRQLFMRSCLVLSFILTLNIAFGGCAPLKKKFIRRKKVSQKEIEPVLDPIDYPSAVVDPEMIYKKNYAMWKIWDKDFDQTFDRGDNDKRIDYVLAKYLFHLEQMKAQLMPRDQEAFQEFLKKGYAVQEEFKKPKPLRNDAQLRREIKRLGKEIRRKYNPKLELNYR